MILPASTEGMPMSSNFVASVPACSTSFRVRPARTRQRRARCRSPNLSRNCWRSAPRLVSAPQIWSWETKLLRVTPGSARPRIPASAFVVRPSLLDISTSQSLRESLSLTSSASERARKSRARIQGPGEDAKTPKAASTEPYRRTRRAVKPSRETSGATAARSVENMPGRSTKPSTSPPSTVKICPASRLERPMETQNFSHSERLSFTLRSGASSSAAFSCCGGLLPLPWTDSESSLIDRMRRADFSCLTCWQARSRVLMRQSRARAAAFRWAVAGSWGLTPTASRQQRSSQSTASREPPVRVSRTSMSARLPALRTSTAMKTASLSRPLTLRSARAPRNSCWLRPRLLETLLSSLAKASCRDL
mmetsp:Transcript_72104/g.211654  ORF Transcript_72104/g.211654 Transcript_72104/m.211654 type:complete len:364 (+) Transcript_72104:262-1353(+)